MIGTTSACASKLFRNKIALEKDEERVCSINMWIKNLWESLDQATSRKPIPPLPSEPWELIELDDELLEDPTIANLTRVDADAQNSEDSSQKEDEENDELIAM